MCKEIVMEYDIYLYMYIFKYINIFKHNIQIYVYKNRPYI